MTCGDCIHYDVCFAANYNECSCNTIADGCKYFQHKSDVQEAKQGEWVVGITGTAVCSRCKCDTHKWFNIALEEYIYCPNCGAKMDNEEQLREV